MQLPKKVMLIFLFTIGGLAMNQANAQRHLKGSNFVELHGGISQLGMYYGLAYGRMLSSSLIAKGEIGMEKGKIDDAAEFSNYYFNPGAYYKLTKLGSSIYLNGGAGLSLTMHQMTYNQEIAEDENIMNYGVFVGLEPEIYFGDNLVLILQAKQFWMIKKDPGSQFFFAGAGLRYNF